MSSGNQTTENIILRNLAVKNKQIISEPATSKYYLDY